MTLTASRVARTALTRVTGKHGSRLFTAVVVLCSLAIAAFSLSMANRKSAPSAGTHFVQEASRRRPAPSGMEGELVVLRNKGFEPSQITRAAGPFLLGVDVRIGANAADLTLSRLAGGKVREKMIPIGNRAWRELVDLPPGQYLLTVANRPSAVCAITIKPR